MPDRFSSGDAGNALRTLVAFSAARSFSLKNNNPLDVILPLFEPIATSLHGQQFSAEKCAAELATRYDLLVSEELCIYWSSQLIKSGLLIPAANDIDSGAYVWNQKSVANSQEGEFAKELVAVLDELRSFLVMSKDIIFQMYTDAELVAVLKNGAISSMFPKLFANGVTAQSDEQYLFARFVEYAAKKQNIVESLATLRRAAIVCDLALHTREPHRPPPNGQMVNVYFDSPLVMDLIGLGGKVRKAHAKRLLEGFKHLNFVPLINPDMVFEISNNLNGLLRKNPRDRYGPTATALRTGEFKTDYVEAVRDHLEAQIRLAGIEIDRNFARHVELSPIDQAAEMELLSATQSHYTRLEAAERDVKSIRGVYGRRGSAQPQDIFSSRAIFLTSNELLAAISNRYFRDRIGYGKGTFPIVVTRSVAAALGDAILGIETTGNMSLTDMLVSAANATQYNGQIFAQIETHLREISPQQADDLLEILERPDFSQLAIDLVRGSPRNVSVQSVQRLTTVIKSRLQAEAELRVSAEINRERLQAALDIEAHRSVISAQSDQLDTALAQLRAKHVADSDIIRTSCARALSVRNKVEIASWFLGAIVATGVGVATYVATYYADAIAHNSEMRFLIALLIALASAWPLYGFPLRERLIQRFVKWQDDGIATKMVALGYSSTGIDLTATTALGCMDQQFNERLALISNSRPEEAAPPARTSLFAE